ncbi:MAG: hypothetical protein EXS13_08440 [Planctomycetes bacterium]|nr:hypothetical protein [Planctomycetota bacterium]
MVANADSPTAASDPHPTRDAIGRSPQRLLHPGSATKAAIVVVEGPEGPRLMKDVSVMHPLVRAIYGRRVLRREERALTALDGMEGVPKLYGRIDGDALLMEFITAETLRRQFDKSRLTKACVALADRVASLHGRGVVHLDLRQKRNVLVDAEGGVVIIDFQSALVLGHSGWRGLLLRLLAPLDRMAVLKHRARYVPESLDANDQKRARRLHRLGQLWFFHRLGPLLRALFGGSRRRSQRSP